MSSDDRRLADLLRLKKAMDDADDASPAFEREIRRQVAEAHRARNEQAQRNRRR